MGKVVTSIQNVLRAINILTSLRRWYFYKSSMNVERSVSAYNLFTNIR